MNIPASTSILIMVGVALIVGFLLNLADQPRASHHEVQDVMVNGTRCILYDGGSYAGGIACDFGAARP